MEVRRFHLETEHFYNVEMLHNVYDDIKISLDIKNEEMQLFRQNDFIIPKSFYLPIDKPFEFTGFIIKKFGEYRYILLEATCNNEPYYYPLRLLRENIFLGDFSEIEFLKSGKINGLEYINGKQINKDLDLIMYSKRSFIDFFNSKAIWKATEIEGYRSSYILDTIPQKNIKSTNWRSKKFIKHVKTYSLKKLAHKKI